MARPAPRLPREASTNATRPTRTPARSCRAKTRTATAAGHPAARVRGIAEAVWNARALKPAARRPASEQRGGTALRRCHLGLEPILAYERCAPKGFLFSAEDVRSVSGERHRPRAGSDAAIRVG